MLTITPGVVCNHSHTAECFVPPVTQPQRQAGSCAVSDLHTGCLSSLPQKTFGLCRSKSRSVSMAAIHLLKYPAMARGKIQADRQTPHSQGDLKINYASKQLCRMESKHLSILNGFRTVGVAILQKGVNLRLRCVLQEAHGWFQEHQLLSMVYQS